MMPRESPQRPVLIEMSTIPYGSFKGPQKELFSRTEELVGVVHWSHDPIRVYVHPQTTHRKIEFRTHKTRNPRATGVNVRHPDRAPRPALGFLGLL